MRILLIEDEKKLVQILKKGLREEHYAVDVAYDGEEGLYLALEEPSDLIILDILLPKRDGLSVLRELRRAGVTTPVLLLTAKDTLPDKVDGLDRGADDYLTKPFGFEELLARIRALLRRSTETRTSLIRIGGLTIDMATHEVRRGKRAIALSAKEYALLEYLALHRRRVLSRTTLTEHLYDNDFDLDSNVIDVFIHRLRGKIDRGHGRKLIRTVRGAGYRLGE